MAMLTEAKPVCGESAVVQIRVKVRDTRRRIVP
jgi:hypothetical protein